MSEPKEVDAEDLLLRATESAEEIERTLDRIGDSLDQLCKHAEAISKALDFIGVAKT